MQRRELGVLLEEVGYLFLDVEGESAFVKVLDESNAEIRANRPKLSDFEVLMKLVFQLGRAIFAGVDDEEIVDLGGDEGPGAVVEALAEEGGVGDEAVIAQVLLEDAAQVVVEYHGGALETVEAFQETN